MATEPRSGTTGASSVWSQAAGHFFRWRDGDPEGLDALVRTLTPVLWHVVRAYRLEREEAEDVVQTTWLSLVRRHDRITDPQAVASWLTTTARREAWRVARAGGRVTPVDTEDLARRIPEQQSAESEVVAADERHLLWRCVAALPERCQRLLRIVAFEDRPDYKHLASEMNMPIGSIGPTRGRCLEKLRRLLGRPDTEVEHA